VSGGHNDRGAKGVSIEAPKAPSGVRYGEGCPLPSRLRGLRERRELPSGVRGRATAAIAFSAYFRPQNASGSFWWRQSPPLSKVVVTSHNRHIQSCAYDCVICYMYFYSVWSVTAGGGVLRQRTASEAAALQYKALFYSVCDIYLQISFDTTLTKWCCFQRYFYKRYCRPNLLHRVRSYARSQRTITYSA